MMLNGRRVFEYVLDDLDLSVYRGKMTIVASTDSGAYRELFMKAGVETIGRPAALATDTAPTLPVLWNVLPRMEKRCGHRFDAVMDIYPCCPIRPRGFIDKVIDLWKKEPRYSIMPVLPCPQRFHPTLAVPIDDNGQLHYVIPYGDQAKQAYRLSVYLAGGAGFLIPRQNFDIYPNPSPPGDAHLGFGERKGIVVDPSRFVDIDSPEDVRRAIALLLRGKALGVCDAPTD